MPASKFTPEVRGALIERFAAGCTVPDAASAVGVREKTLKNWLTQGRRDPGGVHGEFADAVDVARRDARCRPEAMTEEEHRVAVSDACRRGNVQALKLYWEMLLADRDVDDVAAEPVDPLGAADELAERRAVRA